MNLTKHQNRMKKIAILLILITASVPYVFAGFPVGKGRFMLVPSYNLYTAKGYWDQSRIYKPFDNNGRFVSHYFSLYGGYGISRNLNLMFNIPVTSQTFSQTGKVGTNFGLGDLTVGLSTFLTDFDKENHVSLTGSLILPMYQNPTSADLPFLGFQSPGLELKMGIAGSTTKYFRNPYYDIEGGVRTYLNQGGPTQLFINITGGVPIADDWKISGTFSGVSSSSSNVTNVSTGQLFANGDFDYLRLTGNVGHIINDKVSVWFGIFTDISGRNTGRGSGLSLSAVLKL